MNQAHRHAKMNPENLKEPRNISFWIANITFGTSTGWFSMSTGLYHFTIYYVTSRSGNSNAKAQRKKCLFSNATSAAQSGGGSFKNKKL